MMHDNVLLDQMTSALGNRDALVEFEDSRLFLQMVIVISIFYALFPLQVHLLQNVHQPSLAGDHLADRTVGQ